MAKSSRRRLTSSAKKSYTRRLLVFIFSIAFIALMLWQVLMTLGSSSNAYFSQGKCRPARKSSLNDDKHGNNDDKKGGWKFFDFCRTNKANSCADECTCVPLRKNFPWGKCVAKTEVTPTPPLPSATPTPPPPGMKACGETCQTDNECASGYCHDPNWQACPTATPEPITPTCVLRPKCLDSKPKCYPPEPAGGFCPPSVTPTRYPTRIPRPTTICAVHGLTDQPKTCRDRGCFAGEQCACPVLTVTVIPVVTAVPNPSGETLHPKGTNMLQY